MDHLTSSGLYVHIPFCQTKCPYCDFYSITDETLISAYLTALDAEARLYREQFPIFDSLFLGGGTPSLLDAAQLGALVASLRRHFAFAPDSEITLEANPDDVTPEKLRLWRDLVVNRVSLGVQSLDEAELRFLGRRHTARQARWALESARAAGFGNLAVDLMYGLPGQRPETWLQTLGQVLEFGPEHLSCYQLTIAAGETPALRTPFARRAARGEITPLGEEEERAFFLLTARFLTERGYIHYEVSNFARKIWPDSMGRGGQGLFRKWPLPPGPPLNPAIQPLEAYYCRHNLKYWRHVPYLGLGPGAHSFDGARRWWNHASLEQYGAALAAGAAPVAGSETLTPAQLRLEALYLGFRTRDGVGLDLIRRHPRGQEILSELNRCGLVRVADGRAVPTPEGLVVADHLPLLFAE